MSATTSEGSRPCDVQRLAAARDRALGLKIPDEHFELGFLFALDAEGAGDVALGDPRRRLLAIRARRAPPMKASKLLPRRQPGAAAYRRLRRRIRTALQGRRFSQERDSRVHSHN